MQLKTRVVCPPPGEPDNKEMTVAQKAKAAGRGAGINFGFKTTETTNSRFGVAPPPKTLLNLTTNMIDALSVEFVLVTDIKLFMKNK